MLSETLKARGVQRCVHLLPSIKHQAAGRLRFFSDEKIFCINVKINLRNDSWIAHDAEDVSIIGRTKFPASIHILLEGDVTPPHIFAINN